MWNVLSKAIRHAVTSNTKKVVINDLIQILINPSRHKSLINLIDKNIRKITPRNDFKTISTDHSTPSMTLR
jgi:hypothetical protein